MNIKYHVPGRVQTKQVDSLIASNVVDFSYNGVGCQHHYTTGYYAREELPYVRSEYLGHHYNIDILETLAPTRQEVADNPLKYLTMVQDIQTISVMGADAHKADGFKQKVGAKLNIPSSMNEGVWGRTFNSEIKSVPLIGTPIVRDTFDADNVLWNGQCTNISVALILNDVMSPVWALECRRHNTPYRIIKPNLKSALTALEELVIEKVKLDDLVN